MYTRRRRHFSFGPIIRCSVACRALSCDDFVSCFILILPIARRRLCCPLFCVISCLLLICHVMLADQPGYERQLGELGCRRTIFACDMSKVDGMIARVFSVTSLFFSSLIQVRVHWAIFWLSRHTWDSVMWMWSMSVLNEALG